MKQLFFVLFILAWAPSDGTAQRVYRSGYLVLDNTDTIRGLIGCKNWNYLQGALSVKTTDTGRVKNFDLSNVHKIFVSPDEYERVEDITHWYFLHKLVDGAVLQLYEYFPGKNAAPVYCLRYPGRQVFEKLVSDETFLSNGKLCYRFPYQEQLYTFLAGTAANVSRYKIRIYECPYTKKGLSDLVLEINSDFGHTEMPISKPDNFFGLEYGVGITATSLVMTGEGNKLGHLHFTRPCSPQFHVAFSYANAWVMPAWAFHVALSFVQTTAHGTGRPDPLYGVTQSRYTLQQATILLSPGLRFTFLKYPSGVRFYTGLALNFDFSFYPQNHLEQTDGRGYDSRYNDYMYLPKDFNSITLELGMLLHKTWEVNAFGKVSENLNMDTSPFTLRQWAYGVSVAHHIKL